MKKLSIIILTVIIAGIAVLTIYTLTHQDIKGAQEIIKTKSIEKASTNMTENELSEIYNIQLNGKRHKLKSNYRVTFEKKYAKIDLTLYLDGREILSMEVDDKFEADTIDEIFENQNENIKIDKENIKIMKDKETDYLLISVYSDIKGEKEEYFVWNDKGKMLLENILIYDESKEYQRIDEEELTIFYDKNTQILAKFEDNSIYALEEKETEENLLLEEYRYTINKGNVEKELLNTYEIKLKKQK